MKNQILTKVKVADEVWIAAALGAPVAKGSTNLFVPVFMFTSCSIASPIARQTPGDTECCSRLPKAAVACFGEATRIIRSARDQK